MFCELKLEEYLAVDPLFHDRFPYSCSIRALLAGNSSGRIFVDQIQNPRWAMAFTVEGVLLTGDAQDSETFQTLKNFLSQEIFSGKLLGDEDDLITICVDPSTWAEKLTQLIPDREPIPIKRLHFLCRSLNADWRTGLPEGYQVQTGRYSELTDGRFKIDPGVLDWIGIQEDWTEASGRIAPDLQVAAVICDDEIVCWSSTDCFDADWFECGIYTAPEHRRRGLGVVAVSALVAWGFDHGYTRVGWHCDDINHGSINIAKKVGFELDVEYTYYCYQVNQVNHLAELGWFHYQRGDHQKTRDCYEQVFALREENPNYFYHLAALCWGEVNDKEKTLAYLEKAVQSGWNAVDYTASKGEFAFLKDDPHFKAILAKMRNTP
jgi:GNAT superfamily N-acetyltransferase